MRATFSIDADTDSAIRRLAERLDVSRSAVVRRAVTELEARANEPIEKERYEKLESIQRLRAEDTTRLQAEVERELEALRSARRTGWRNGS